MILNVIANRTGYSNPWILVLAVFLIFVVIPLLFRLVLKLFDAKVSVASQHHRWVTSNHGEPSGDWGRDDAGLIASSQRQCPLPHERGVRPGMLR